VNVLHLIGPDYPASALFGLRCACRPPTPTGRPPRAAAFDARSARRWSALLGVTVEPLAATARLAHLSGASWLAGPALRRLRGRSGFDLLHAWGIDAAAACRAVPEFPSVVTLERAPTERDARRMRIMLAPSMPIIVAAQATRRRLAEVGIDPRRCVVIRPPIDFRAVNDARAARSRDRVAPPTEGPIILTTGPASRGGGQFVAAWAAGMVSTVHTGLRIVVPFESAERERIRAFLRAVGFGNLWLNPPREWGWPELTAASDAMLDASAEEGPIEPLAWAMASGVPIAASAIRSTTELIADHHNGLLCRTAEPHPVARVLLRLVDDAALRRKLADTARGQAYEVFSVREYCDNVRRLHENVLAGRAADEGVRDTAMAG